MAHGGIPPCFMKKSIMIGVMYLMAACKSPIPSPPSGDTETDSIRVEPTTPDTESIQTSLIKSAAIRLMSSNAVNEQSKIVTDWWLNTSAQFTEEEQRFFLRTGTYRILVHTNQPSEGSVSDALKALEALIISRVPFIDQHKQCITIQYDSDMDHQEKVAQLELEVDIDQAKRAFDEQFGN